jgi:hypothetical protein
MGDAFETSFQLQVLVSSSAIALGQALIVSYTCCLRGVDIQSNSPKCRADHPHGFCGKRSSRLSDIDIAFLPNVSQREMLAFMPPTSNNSSPGKSVPVLSIEFN